MLGSLGIVVQTRAAKPEVVFPEACPLGINTKTQARRQGLDQFGLLFYSIPHAEALNGTNLQGRNLDSRSLFCIPCEPGAVSIPLFYYLQTLQNENRHAAGKRDPVGGIHRKMVHQGHESSAQAISMGQARQEGVKKMRSKPARSQGGAGGYNPPPCLSPKVTVHAIKYMYRSWILPLWGP